MSRGVGSTAAKVFFLITADVVVIAVSLGCTVSSSPPPSPFFTSSAADVVVVGEDVGSVFLLSSPEEATTSLDALLWCSLSIFLVFFEEDTPQFLSLIGFLEIVLLLLDDVSLELACELDDRFLFFAPPLTMGRDSGFDFADAGLSEMCSLFLSCLELLFEQRSSW